MNRFFSPKFVVAATLATAALGAATVAEAHPDIGFSIGFQSGPSYYEPAPVYVRPPVYVAPREIFEAPRWGGYESRFEREREWRRAEQRRHEWQERHFRGGDHDRDDHGRRGW